MKNSEREDKFLGKWGVKRQHKLRYILIFGGIIAFIAIVVNALALYLTGLKSLSELYAGLPYLLIGWTLVCLIEGWLSFYLMESEYKRILKSRQMPIPVRK